MSSPAASDGGGGARWTREDDEAFEDALATVNKAAEEGEEAWLERVASRVVGKTVAEVRRHYEALAEDVDAIEAGRVPVPRYAGEEERESNRRVGIGRVGIEMGGQGKGCSKTDQGRRRGIPWTEDEHRLFLLGLDKFGKGDWRSISRNFVSSRTPTQVASHAQKYFIRLKSINKDRRRSSIHDTTRVNGGDVCSPQGPITEQASMNSTVAGSSMRHPLPPNMPRVGIYGPHVGHPVNGHTVSSVGTPVMLPPGDSPYFVPFAYPSTTMYQ